MAYSPRPSVKYPLLVIEHTLTYCSKSLFLVSFGHQFIIYYLSLRVHLGDHQNLTVILVAVLSIVCKTPDVALLSLVMMSSLE